MVMTNSSPWKIIMLLIGKPSLNGPFSKQSAGELNSGWCFEPTLWSCQNGH